MHILHTGILSERRGDFNKLSTLCHCVPVKCKTVLFMFTLWGEKGWGLFRVTGRHWRCQTWAKALPPACAPQPLTRRVCWAGGCRHREGGSRVSAETGKGQASHRCSWPMCCKMGNKSRLEGHPAFFPDSVPVGWRAAMVCELCLAVPPRTCSPWCAADAVMHEAPTFCFWLWTLILPKEMNG